MKLTNGNKTKVNNINPILLLSKPNSQKQNPITKGKGISEERYKKGKNNTNKSTNFDETETYK